MSLLVLFLVDFKTATSENVHKIHRSLSDFLEASVA